MRTSNKNESGMLTVEATLALVPFLMVIIGIISFINVFMVHNRIQYAIFQAGSELSAYTYLYQALNVRQADLSIKEDADKATEDLDKMIEYTSNFMDNMVATKESYDALINSNLSNVEDNYNAANEQTNEMIESGKETYNQAVYMFQNPKTILHGIVYTGIEKGIEGLKSLLAELLAGGMANVYIQTDTMSAEEYLKKFGVVDGKLDFGDSILFGDDDRRMIDIVVTYDLEIFMFKLFMKDPTIHMVQRCTIPAWLDGDGGDFNKE